MAALRFAVSEEDGTFIGQSFIPVAHLRPGYRHVVLRNQINVPVQSSSLFIFVRKDVHVDAENKELIDQLVSPTSVSIMNKEQQPKQTKFKPLCEQRSHSVGELNTIRDNSINEIKTSNDNSSFSSNMSTRHYYPSTTEVNKTPTDGTSYKKRNQSTPLFDANFYHNQLISTSQLHDQNNLCKDISLEDIEQMKYFKRRRETIQGKIRRASADYDKKIQSEEERFYKHLTRLRNGMHSSFSRPINSRPSTELNINNNSYIDGRTTSFIHQRIISEEVKQGETRLLDLYSSKFHTQNELEYKLSKEYYNELEKYINDYYAKQLNHINYILKQEQSKVKEDVRVQMKNETKKTLMTETDREKIVNLKEKIRQMNIEAGALAIRKLQEMHEKLEKIIRTNLQTTLNHLHEEKDLETKSRFTKYSDKLNEIKSRLQRDVYGNEYNGPRDNSSSSSHRSTITASSSLSSIAQHPHEIAPSLLNCMASTPPAQYLSTSNQLTRRQTLNRSNTADSQPDDEEFMCYLNQTNESTRL